MYLARILRIVSFSCNHTGIENGATERRIHRGLIDIAMVKKMMVDHEAFLKGIKPALYRAYNQGLAELFPILKGYPHLKDHTGRFLFFNQRRRNRSMLTTYGKLI
jgi:hypothetical protein